MKKTLFALLALCMASPVFAAGDLSVKDAAATLKILSESGAFVRRYPDASLVEVTKIQCGGPVVAPQYRVATTSCSFKDEKGKTVQIKGQPAFDLRNIVANNGGVPARARVGVGSTTAKKITCSTSMFVARHQVPASCEITAQ